MSEHKGNGRALLRTPQRNLKEQVIKERKLTFSNGTKQQLGNLQAIYRCALSLLEEKEASKELAMAKLLALQAEHDFKVALAQCRLAKRALNAGTAYEIQITNTSANRLSFAISSDLPDFSGSPAQVITNAIWSGYIETNTTDTWRTNIQYYAFVETRDSEKMPTPGTSSNGQKTYQPVDLSIAKKSSTLSITNMTWEDSSIGLTEPVHAGSGDNLADGAFRITTPDNYINLDSKHSRSFEPMSLLILVTGLTAGMIYNLIYAKRVNLNLDIINFKFQLDIERPPLGDEAADPGLPVSIITEAGFHLNLNDVCSLIYDAIEQEGVFNDSTFKVKPNTMAKHRVYNRASPGLQKAYFNVGLGMSSSDPHNKVVMASYINGPPNMNIDITPVTTYYVMISEAKVGTVIDTKEWSVAAKVDFTNAGGASTAYVNYEPNGDWDVSF